MWQAKFFVWTALYCIKLSFMFLYKVVLGSNRKPMMIWYAALVYIVCCYGICLIGVFGQCGEAQHLWTVQECSTTYVAALDQKLFWVDYFSNVSSDLVGRCSGPTTVPFHLSFAGMVLCRQWSSSPCRLSGD